MHSAARLISWKIQHKCSLIPDHHDGAKERRQLEAPQRKFEMCILLVSVMYSVFLIERHGKFRHFAMESQVEQKSFKIVSFQNSAATLVS